MKKLILSLVLTFSLLSSTNANANNHDEWSINNGGIPYILSIDSYVDGYMKAGILGAGMGIELLNFSWKDSCHGNPYEKHGGVWVINGTRVNMTIHCGDGFANASAFSKDGKAYILNEFRNSNFVKIDGKTTFSAKKFKLMERKAIKRNQNLRAL